MTTATFAVTLALGGTAAYGAINPAFLSQISDFVSDIFNTENAKIVNTGNTEQNNDVSSLNTFLSNLKTHIQTEVQQWSDTENTRVSTEIQSHHDDLQSQAETQATSDMNAKKAALSDTANLEILEGKAALDAKFNELFPAPSNP